MKKSEFIPMSAEQMRHQVEQFMIHQHEYEEQFREQRAQEIAKIEECRKALGCKSHLEFVCKIKEINQILTKWELEDCPY